MPDHNGEATTLSDCWTELDVHLSKALSDMKLSVLLILLLGVLNLSATILAHL